MRRRARKLPRVNTRLSSGLRKLSLAQRNGEANFKRHCSTSISLDWLSIRSTLWFNGDLCVTKMGGGGEVRLCGERIWLQLCVCTYDLICPGIISLVK